MTEEELIQRRTMEAIVKLSYLKGASKPTVAQFGAQGAEQQEADGSDRENQQVVAELIELAECVPSKQNGGEQ